MENKKKSSKSTCQTYIKARQNNQNTIEAQRHYHINFKSNCATPWNFAVCATTTTTPYSRIPPFEYVHKQFHIKFQIVSIVRTYVLTKQAIKTQEN